MFFQQWRAGLDREVFRLWKFRTMYVGADVSAVRDHVTLEMRGEDTSTREMLTLDVQCVRNRTLLGDIGVIARMLPALFRVDGAR